MQLLLKEFLPFQKGHCLAFPKPQKKFPHNNKNESTDVNIFELNHNKLEKHQISDQVIRFNTSNLHVFAGVSSNKIGAVRGDLK